MDPAPNAASLSTLQYSEVFDPAVILITVLAVRAEPDRDRSGPYGAPIANKPGEFSGSGGVD
jgi:hypothetical protein